MKRMLFILFVAFALSAGPLLVGGCDHVKPTAVQATGDAIAQTDAHLDSQAPHLAYLAKHAEGEGKVHAETAQAENVAAKKSNGTAGDSFRRVANQLNAVLAGWPYKIGTFVVRFIWWLVGAIFLAIVLRSLALTMTGPVGAGVSFASHVLLGVGTLGASVVHSILENVFWRQVRPQQQGTPTDPELTTSTDPTSASPAQGDAGNVQ